MAGAKLFIADEDLKPSSVKWSINLADHGTRGLKADEQKWVLPQTADVRLPIPDSVGLGLTKAWGLHPQWTVWHGQWSFGAAVSTALTTCIRIPDQFEERIPCLTYKVF
ncbi:unnamed protein product [Echinostoma caproni]|uniref:UbiD family decarboxylase n=1 Tax=Echinostoma caproni TaxID=27848 RepID=A0A183A7T2_9TREM|nr:unnamed protein product [Echinostoma caproni]